MYHEPAFHDAVKRMLAEGGGSSRPRVAGLPAPPVRARLIGPSGQAFADHPPRIRRAGRGPLFTVLVLRNDIGDPRGGSLADASREQCGSALVAVHFAGSDARA